LIDDKGLIDTMKYVILAWSKDWELIKDVEPTEYDKNAYNDAYFVTGGDDKLLLFNTDQDALVFARKYQFFKIINFYEYMSRVELE
jgi:hypothetical protein